MNIRGYFAALSLTVPGFALVACSSSNATTTTLPEADTGTIAAALTAVGPDGATYTLAGAYLELSWTNEGGLQQQFLQFDSTTPTQSFSVAPATYSATLHTQPTLTRIADGGATTVPAKLLDPQPYTFSVAAGQTTPLTFHFAVGFGNVTFSTGTLSTSLQVEAGAAQPTRAQASGTANVATASLHGPPALNAALPATATVSLSYSVAATLTSPFAASVDGACANITATITASSGTSATEQNFAALFNEASGGSGTLCFYSQNSTNLPGQMSLGFLRPGAPQTSQMIAALGAAAVPNESFYDEIDGLPSTPLYDGSTLALSRLNQPITLQLTGLFASYAPNLTYASVVISGTPPTVTLTITP
jgi:hypothetical protein